MMVFETSIGCLDERWLNGSILAYPHNLKFGIWGDEERFIGEWGLEGWSEDDFATIRISIDVLWELYNEFCACEEALIPIQLGFRNPMRVTASPAGPPAKETPILYPTELGYIKLSIVNRTYIYIYILILKKGQGFIVCCKDSYIVLSLSIYIYISTALMRDGIRSRYQMDFATCRGQPATAAASTLRPSGLRP